MGKKLGVGVQRGRVCLEPSLLQLEKANVTLVRLGYANLAQSISRDSAISKRGWRLGRRDVHSFIIGLIRHLSRITSVAAIL